LNDRISSIVKKKFSSIVYDKENNVFKDAFGNVYEDKYALQKAIQLELTGQCYGGHIDIVYDGMWGSCGKGKFCGEMALNNAYDVCVNNNAPNAGHTFVFEDGRNLVTRHIPIGVVDPYIKYLVIGEGAVINPSILKE